MTIDMSSLGVQEALSMAILAEIDAADIYRQLTQKVHNFVMREKIFFLIGEEEKHRRILEALFDKLFPNQSPDTTRQNAFPRPKPDVSADSAVPDVLEQAMEAEKLFEDFYNRLSKKVEEKGAQQILQYLSEMEKGHYNLLKLEYDKCLEDEQYYERGDFEYDMVHIGP